MSSIKSQSFQALLIPMFLSSCDPSQVRYRPLKSTETLGSHLVVPYSPNWRPGNERPIGPLYCLGICSMHTSKIREIMALLSPLYHGEMLKNAKVQVS
jgi:hypothetical protein